MLASLKEFLTELIKNKVEHWVLNPLPLPQDQRGPNCGFYSLSTAISFYNNCDSKRYAVHFARKDKRKDVDSLRAIAKRKGFVRTAGGAIWDVNLFKSILEETQYDCKIDSFYTQSSMSKILRTTLMQNLPVVLAVDSPLETAVSMLGGAGAHYITIIGCYKKEGSWEYIFTTYDKYYFVKESDLFKSCNNLEKYPSVKYFLSAKKDWNRLNPKSEAFISAHNPEIKIYEQPEVDLKGLRNKCVTVFPKNFDKKAHFNQALSYAKETDNVVMINEFSKLYKSTSTQIIDQNAEIEVPMNENKWSSLVALATEYYNKDESYSSSQHVLFNKTKKRFALNQPKKSKKHCSSTKKFEENEMTKPDLRCWEKLN